VRNIRPRAPGERSPFEQLERTQDESAVRRARAERYAALAARRGTFLAATLLVVLGFLLQLAGAWPGCCPPWIASQP
jgi:hypothetical protein